MPRFLLLSALLLLSACASSNTPTGDEDWTPLFADDLSDAIYPDGIWTVTDGVLTASEDQAIWTDTDHERFVLDLEFMTAEGTNSGVIIYVSDIDNWIPNSVEVQIADDYAEQWATAPPTWQCGALFGHQAATQQRVVKEPGVWNRYTITADGPMIEVVLNGQTINTIDLRLFTSAEVNPDGSEVPAWLSIPPAELPTRGRIGLQGKHAGAPIYFRNLRIKPLP